MSIELRGKRVAIVGMGRTGMAAAEVLRDLGAEVTLLDRKPRTELPEAITEAERLNAHTIFEFDGQNSIGDFDIVVPSPGVRSDLPALHDAESRGVTVIAEIEMAYLISPAPIIAVTGTNGKTTTTVMIGKMLEADGRKVLIAGNVVAGDIRMALITAAHQATMDGVIVAEISTFQLERIQRFRPYIAALLNVSEDHLDRHADVEEYAALKSRVFANQSYGDWAIVNADDTIASRLAPSRGPRILRFSRREELAEGAFLKNGRVIVRFDGGEMDICSVEDINLRGTHNQENVLAACCAAAAFGAKPESMAAAIREFQPIEHRMEPVAVIDDVEYLNNSMCTNVMAAVRSIEAIEEPVIVIVGGVHKGGDLRPLARTIASRVKSLILIGESAHVIQDAAVAEGCNRITMSSSLKDAVLAAKNAAQPGDVVMLVPGCASFDMFENFEDRGNRFKEIVRSLGG